MHISRRTLIGFLSAFAISALAGTPAEGQTQKPNIVFILELGSLKGDNAWIFTPVFREIEKYEASVKEYPNIKPGEDFKGYPGR